MSIIINLTLEGSAVMIANVWVFGCFGVWVFVGISSGFAVMIMNVWMVITNV